jgi:hypothetical protein
MLDSGINVRTVNGIVRAKVHRFGEYAGKFGEPWLMILAFNG